jgi:hypothetical protein
MDSNMRETLAKWGFLPIDTNGQPKADEQPPQKPKDESTRKLAEKVLSIPDVKL